MREETEEEMLSRRCSQSIGTFVAPSIAPVRAGTTTTTNLS